MRFAVTVLLMLNIAACGDARIENAKKIASEAMRDPSSVQFRNIAFAESSGAVCGEINSKNGFGGYLGFRRFAVEGDRLWIQSDIDIPKEDVSALADPERMRQMSDRQLELDTERLRRSLNWEGVRLLPSKEQVEIASALGVLCSDPLSMEILANADYSNERRTTFEVKSYTDDDEALREVFTDVTTRCARYYLFKEKFGGNRVMIECRDSQEQEVNFVWDKVVQRVFGPYPPFRA